MTMKKPPMSQPAWKTIEEMREHNKKLEKSMKESLTRLAIDLVIVAIIVFASTATVLVLLNALGIL